MIDIIQKRCIKFFAKLIFFTFILTGIAPEFCFASEEGDLSKMAEFLDKNYGIKFRLNADLLEVFVFQDKAISAIPDLQRRHMIGDGISMAEIKKDKIIYAGVVGECATALLIYSIYKLTNTDNLHVSIYLLSHGEDYGSSGHLIFSFRLNRKIYEQTDWKTPSLSIENIGLNFKRTVWYMTEGEYS